MPPVLIPEAVIRPGIGHYGTSQTWGVFIGIGMCTLGAGSEAVVPTCEVGDFDADSTPRRTAIERRALD